MNTKHKNYKKVLRILRRQEEISAAQRNLGYEKLDKPYLKGWDGYWGLRVDIARSDEGEGLQVLLDHFGKTIFSDNEEFKTWNYKEKKYEYHKPYFKLVPEDEWENFYSWAQKWFTYDPSEDKYNYWYGGMKKFYKCNIPEWMLVMKKQKHWVTHYKVFDNVLVQEDAELDYEYQELIDHRGWYRMGDKSSKWYQNYRNRSFRYKNKRAINKAMRTDDWEGMDLPVPKKQVKWDMW